MNSSKQGFLVVFSDVKSEDEQDYFRWLTTEHFPERLGIAGFLGVRVFKAAISGGSRYFIWYELDNADVVDSPAYVDRLNNPTPWSQRIMPILENFGRGGGTVRTSIGKKPGAYVLTVALAVILADASAIMQKIANIGGVASAHLLVTDLKKTTVQTSERRLRTKDESFAGWLIIEAADRDTLTKIFPVVSGVSALADDRSIGGPYELVFLRES